MKLWTVSEIAYNLNITVEYVGLIYRKLELVPVDKLKQKGTRDLFLFTDEQKQLMEAYKYKAHRDKFGEPLAMPITKEPEGKTLEALKKFHPLVTDYRCFNINYWPDVVPVGLSE